MHISEFQSTTQIFEYEAQNFTAAMSKGAQPKNYEHEMYVCHLCM